MPATKTALKNRSYQTRDDDSSKKKNKAGIKYTDKSPGQQNLTPIFEAIKKLLLPYEKETMKLISSGGQVTLISKQPVEILVIHGAHHNVYPMSMQGVRKSR